MGYNETSMNTSNQPIFQTIFADKWPTLPKVFKSHYAIRADSNDVIVAKGTISVEYSWLVAFFKPLMSCLKILPLKRAHNIPIEVIFSCAKNPTAFCFNRIFYYPQGKFEFNSKQIPLEDNLIVEMTQWNLGWKFTYEYENGQVLLNHNTYVLKLFSWYIPLPLGIFLGRCFADETPISDTEFKMRVQFRHWLFGVTYQYYGTFKIVS